MYVDVSAVGQAVLNPDALPEPMRDWYCYRLEYGGHAERCIMEQTIFLPPMFKVEELEDAIREAQG